MFAHRATCASAGGFSLDPERGLLGANNSAVRGEAGARWVLAALAHVLQMTPPVYSQISCSAGSSCRSNGTGSSTCRWWPWLCSCCRPSSSPSATPSSWPPFGRRGAFSAWGLSPGRPSFLGRVDSSTHVPVSIYLGIRRVRPPMGHASWLQRARRACMGNYRPKSTYAPEIR